MKPVKKVQAKLLVKLFDDRTDVDLRGINEDNGQRFSRAFVRLAEQSDLFACSIVCAMVDLVRADPNFKTLLIKGLKLADSIEQESGEPETASVH